jgi:hypothetical protein
LEVIISQAGIVDFLGSHPQVPTLFVANVGSAIPIANTLEILGTVVSAHSIPLETTGSGNTITIEVQYASAAASSVGTNAGVASFNSSQFTVDSNGFVSISGGSFTEAFAVDASTPPGTNPVVPNGSGIITVTGGQVAAGTTTHVIQTNSIAANTYTIQIQRSQAVASSTIGDNGVSHFNSTYFTVDANGFVSLSGTTVGQTITGNVGGALSPTAGNWNIFGTSTAAGTTPVQTSGTGSTLTVQVQKAQAIAATDATKIGLAAFDSARFSVDANGFVTLSGTGVAETITGNTGGALSPTSGNWNIVGTGSITTSGSVSTLTVQLTGLTNHAVQIGAGTATLTQVGPSATTGSVLASNGLSSDPSFQTIASLGAITTITGNSGGAEVPSSGNFNILGTGSITVAGSANTETVQLTGLTNHNVLVGAGTATITNVAPSATSGIPLVSNGSSSDPSFTTAVVAGGGTGDTSFTAYAPICGGTTTTGALQSASTGIGTSGFVLTSNGSSALPSFKAVAASGAFTSIAVQTFSYTGSSQTYTPTSGMLYCTIEVIGGGGGGGGSAAGGASSGAVGGGGGGGGYGRKTVSAATIGASQTVSIAAGGTGGNGANPGNTGGTVSVGSIVSATGGGGGAASGAAVAINAAGGSGGVGSSGDVNSSGGSGGIGSYILIAGVAQSLYGGVGGDSFLGGGAQAVTTQSGATNLTGNNGSNYGGGGGGGGASSSSGAGGGIGGNGAAGFVIITEYI